MAETATRSKAKLGWAKSGMDSSSGDEDAVIPGVNSTTSGNLRPKVKSRRLRDVRTKPASQKVAEEVTPSSTTLSVQDLSQSLDERRLHLSVGEKRGQVSLKDLCVEDKQRIANLIKELAKVGEEREKAREDLEKERRSYEQQILKLVEQQEQILHERQEVENHLQQCQQLLAQSQQFHHPPPQPPHLPNPPLSTGMVPPSSSLPPHLYGQWPWPAGEGQVQDAHHSLLGNVGSPHRQAVPPALARLSEGEVEMYRYQQPEAPTTAVPASLHPPTPNTRHPAVPPSTHLHSSNHHAGGGDLAPQPLSHRSPHQQASHPHQHKQSPEDFFAKALKQSEPLDVFSAKDDRLPSAPCQTSKEEVIQRFFASQPAVGDGDVDEQLMSPKRHDTRKPSKSKPPTCGYFPRPIMSSTQKSAEFRDCLSVDSHQEYVPLVPDESSKSWSEGDGRREGEEKRGGVNRVMFVEGGEQELRRYSPSGDGGDNPHTYRKMSQTQRKEQLLQQRAQLLEEQQRLNHILTEQENMLREKQLALQARSGRHNGDVELDAKGVVGDISGDDPLGLVPQRLAIDAALERQRAIVDSLELEAQHRTKSSSGTTTTTASTTPRLQGNPSQEVERGERKGRGSEGRSEGRRERRGEEKGGETFVVHSQQLSNVVRKLDYSLHSDSEEVAEDRGSEDESNADDREDDEREETPLEEEEEEEKPPSSTQKQDVGTSVSYHTIPRSGHQNPRERDGGDWRSRPDRAFSASHPSPSHKPHTPGEKTMSVLEIINSLHTPPRTRQDDIVIDPRPSPHQHRFPSLTHEPSPSSHLTKAVSPFSKWPGIEEDEIVDIILMDSCEDDEEILDEENEDAGDEDLEESQILEDIFFLK